MSKPTSASYYDDHEVGRLSGAYRLLEAVLGDGGSDDDGRASRGRSDRHGRCNEARRPAERALALAESVGR